jgi:hypothetical protein
MSESSKYNIQSEVTQITEKNDGTIIGKQVLSQPSPELAQALATLQNVLKQLQTKYPQAYESQATTIIDTEFESVRLSKPQQWQTLLNVLSVVFAGGFETVKVFFPHLGIPIEVGKQIYEIYNRDRKQLPEK